MLLYSDINTTDRRRETQQIFVLRSPVKHGNFSSSYLLNSSTSVRLLQKRCNSSLARHKSTFQAVSMEMRRRFRVKQRQSDPELQVCPIPRYLREQEVLTSRARSRQTPPPRTLTHSLTCLRKYLSVCHSFS